MFHNILYTDDPEKKSKFLRKHMESESEIRDMIKTPEYKTAVDLVSKIVMICLITYNYCDLRLNIKP